MQRQPEPELMDEAAQAEAYALADFEEPHEAFVDFYAAHLPPPPAGARVLDLGCGPADITLRFARRYPHTRLVGIDGAQAMLAFGRRFVEERGMADRIVLRQTLLQALETPEPRYDVIISNSLLHHLHQPGELWRAVHRCARHGSSICIMDLCRPADIEQVEHLARTYAGDAPPVLQRDFYNSLRAAFTEQEVNEQLARHALDYLAVETISDRHLVVYGAYQG